MNTEIFKEELKSLSQKLLIENRQISWRKTFEIFSYLFEEVKEERCIFLNEEHDIIAYVFYEHKCLTMQFYLEIKQLTYEGMYSQRYFIGQADNLKFDEEIPDFYKTMERNLGRPQNAECLYDFTVGKVRDLEHTSGPPEGISFKVRLEDHPHAKLAFRL